MRLNSTKLLLVGAFALMASLSFAQVVEPTDSTKVEQDENVSLGETLIIGKGVIDVAENRKTPVANTIITKEEIQDKAVGNVEFPEIMKNSPSVYVADQASGFGDGKMFLRGFDQSNTAYLLNGQPINGMEDGNVYWSNWSSMTDVANVIDVQRGLGSSKLAISSVGGTVNIVTKATELRQGGFVRYVAGNDSYQKATVGYNTGMKGKWGASFLFDYWTAHRKYARGTDGEGQSYFVSVGYKPNDRHQFNWMLFGAPQQHGQNYSKPMTKEYLKDKNGNLTDIIKTPGYDMTGKKGNSNYGFYNGEAINQRTNFYHKPVTNLNWDFTINENASLSTVLYASVGRGGGTGLLGNGPGYTLGGYNPDGSINYDLLAEINTQQPNGVSDGNNGTVLRASMNNHFWYGGVTNFNYDTKTGWAFNVGADVRFYEGDHFQQLVNTLGSNGRVANNVHREKGYVVNKTYKISPWNSLFNSAKESERVGYDNSEKINYQGGFGQVEYSNDIFSAFVQGAISNQSYQKFDRWNYNADHKDVVSGKVKLNGTEAKSSVRNDFGWNLKGGVAVNITKENKVFVNAGKYSRQPFLDNVFLQNTVSFVEPEVGNEEILGFEAGYKYVTRDLKVNVNAYYTKWENRADSYTQRDFEHDGVSYRNVRYLLSDLTQVHKGIEVDFDAKITRDWSLRGFTSVGDWTYDGDFNYKVQDSDTGNVIDGAAGRRSLDGVKVGNAAQFTFGMGTKVKVAKGLSFDTDFNYYARLYGNVNVEDVAKAQINGEVYQNESIRPYALVDFGATYEFKFGSQKIKFRGNIKNLFNDQYIGRKDAYGYFYGLGRTWNAGVTYNF